MYRTLLVTGASGLVGSSLLRKLEISDFKKILTPSRQELNLLNESHVEESLQLHRPEVIINLAAKVGGILANKKNQIDYFTENLLIGINIYKYAAKYGVKKIINIGAGCGYPINSPEPLAEENFWNGRPQEESIGYSTAKKLHLLLAEMYGQKFGIVSNSFIPSNLYGPNDNFNLENAHVIPALIHKFYLAKLNNFPFIEIWGDGTAKRDFLYVDDLSDAIIESFKWNESSVVNVASGIQTSVRELSDIMIEILDYKGEILWDRTMPSGQNSRLMSITKLNKKMDLWEPVSLQLGLSNTIKWFLENINGKPGIRL